MSSIVLSKIGGAIGFAIGGPLGASIGYAIGGMAGHAVDQRLMSGNVKYKVSGSRLADLAVQSSSYGKTIPIVFGKVRIAGNIIWSLPLREHEHVSETRMGKGRPKLHTTSYTYTSTLAIAICEGPIDSILNIWADTRLITAEIKNFRIYKGDESQLPDPLIQSFEGMEKTPAYRGLAYIVIEDFVLTEYGNRIPNFTFEVQRRARVDADAGIKAVEDMLTSICIIPGSGEFVYDTQIQYKVAGETINEKFVQGGKARAINMNNNRGVADAVLSLDALQETVPNLKWVAPVVTWFATSLSVKECIVMPGVEFKDVQTHPDVWRVGKYERHSAHQVKLKNNSPIYGGSVSDASVLRYLDEIKSRGLKIMFYPMMFLDLYDKPWRGHMEGSPEEIREFFTKDKGYNQFILHYADLVKGKVDAFVIGSELKKLTACRDKDGSFPAVDELCKLAIAVKEVLGPSVAITYAADWSEYHHMEGGWYSMDKLWACPAIDVVGIDAYFPLTENLSHASEEEIMHGWNSGEGHDHYLMGATKIKLDAPHAWKNIKWWWENEHINPDGKKTPWVPRSKKIWLTEFGFPSVDGASNQPNVFYDPECFDGGLPKGSKGAIDFHLQRKCIRASLRNFAGSDMVENMFLWCWDARPYPFWPSWQHIWKDGDKWSRGHWVNGKFGLSSLGDAIAEISHKCGFTRDKIDVRGISDIVDGYVLNSNDSGRSFIENLAMSYFFDCSETEGKIKFTDRKNVAHDAIDFRDLIYKSDTLVNIRPFAQQHKKTVFSNTQLAKHYTQNR